MTNLIRLEHMDLEKSIQPEEENLLLTDKDILTKIWSSPREVFKYLTENQYDKYLYVLLILAGISSAFERASTKNMGDSMPIAGILLICIVFGGLFGWIAYYLYAALLSWTGEWLNGKGNTNSILRVISYAMIPSIVSILLLIPQITIFGNEVFQSSFDIFSYGLLSIIIYFIIAILELTLGIWTIVILVIGISEVQKISIGKSIFNLILPALIIVVPIAIIALLFGNLF